MGLGYWKVDNIYLLVSQVCHKNMILKYRLYFGGPAIQRMPFQNCNFEGHLDIQDGRPALLIFLSFFKISLESFQM